MFENDHWLLPEGIEEVLPPQAERLELLRRQILDMYSAWGYLLVHPPLIEYLDSLLTGMGTDLDLQTFKLTDQLTGRLMGMRADMTPQVARIDAHHLTRQGPSRLCYLGTVLRTRPQSHGGTRSPLQVGLELYGHAGPESDIEVLRLMVATLRAAGLHEIHLDLGHVGIFRALARQAGLDAEAEAMLFDALQRKAKPEISEFLSRYELSAESKSMLLQLADLNGGQEVLDEAQSVLAQADLSVHAALENLRAIARAAALEPGVHIHLDLAELRGYRYHTGVVFAAFVPGRGQSIAQGGRYDDIGKVFGRARPATGFSTDLKSLMSLVPVDDKTFHNRGIFAPAANDDALEAAVAALRANGERVVRALPGQEGSAAESGCDRELILKDGHWKVVALGE